MSNQKVSASFAMIFGGLLLAGAVFGQDQVITETSAGKVRLGMTVAEVRAAVSPMTLKRTIGADGVVEIGVNSGEQEVMTLFAGEENEADPINDKAVVESIEVWDKAYQIANGVHPGMLLSEAEKIYGKVTEIMQSEIEAQEFATFTRQPKGFMFKLSGDGDNNAGNYPRGKNTTTRYTVGAFIETILISKPRVDDTPAASSCQVVTKGGNLNVRDAKGAIIGKLANGTKVTVMTRSDNGAEIEFNGGKGWVAVLYLKCASN
jgi:hypothetical protein